MIKIVALISTSKPLACDFLHKCAHDHDVDEISGSVIGEYLSRRYNGESAESVMQKLNIHSSWRNRFEGMYKGTLRKMSPGEGDDNNQKNYK